MTKGQQADQIADPLWDAIELYRQRFGEAPGVWEFMGYPQELTAEILGAVQRGKKLTGATLYKRLGLKPPPRGAIL